MTTTPITVAYGDGIGPKIMEAALLVLREADAPLEIETVEIGGEVYKLGGSSGVWPAAWESLKRSGVLLKGPTFAPPEEHFEDAGAAIRKSMGIEEAPHMLYHDDFTNEKLAAACVGERFALFETLQEPEHAADPAPMLFATTMMLDHIGLVALSSRIRHALQLTRQAGFHIAAGFFDRGKTSVTAQEFAEEVARRL